MAAVVSLVKHVAFALIIAWLYPVAPVDAAGAAPAAAPTSKLAAWLERGWRR
jgi:hypothetical protein